MATIILIIAFMIELVLAVFSIRTKSRIQSIRSMIRIGAFLAFAGSIAASVIVWSFRWEGLAALLLVWAVIGCIKLIKLKLQNKKITGENPVKYRRGRVIRNAIVSLLLVAIALIPALVFPEHQPIETTGKYKVASNIDTYTDETRVETFTSSGEPRKLTVEFWYPGNGQERSCPLVVFSHGSFGVKTSNESLFRELASHGYVVCSIDHTYQCLYTTDVYGKTTWIDMGFMKEIAAEDAHTHIQQSYEYYQKWMGIRTGDINFVIDSIHAKAENNNADTVYKLADTSKIGVMGHSLGGSAALGIGRMRGDISAVVALESPFLCDIQGVKDDEFIFTSDDYPSPVLNVYSDQSWSHLKEWAQYAENAALLSDTGGTAYQVHINGAGHLSLTDLSLTSPFLTRVLNGGKPTPDTVSCLKTINKICLEFFDCYLKGERKFMPGGIH